MKETITPAKVTIPTNLIPLFYDAHVVQFGSFILKSGKTSSVYIDMRNCISSIPLLNTLSNTLHTITRNLTFDRMCGVPHGAVPLATALALKNNTPLIMLRKQTKEHGTKKMIESIYHKGEHVLLIEDVVTTGSSILQATEKLENADLIVKDIVVILDREQGGVKTLKEKGYNVHVVTTLSEVLAAKQ